MNFEVIILRSVHARRTAGGRMRYNSCLLMVKGWPKMECHALLVDKVGESSSNWHYFKSWNISQSHPTSPQRYLWRFSRQDTKRKSFFLGSCWDKSLWETGQESPVWPLRILYKSDKIHTSHEIALWIELSCEPQKPRLDDFMYWMESKKNRSWLFFRDLKILVHHPPQKWEILQYLFLSQPAEFPKC